MTASDFPPSLPDDRPFDVIGLGGNAVDHILTVPHFPSPDSKMKFQDYSFQGGGRTATPMVAIARLGFRARYVGCIGDDAEGEASLASLREGNVDVRAVRIRPGGLTQRAFVLVDADTGERTIIWGRSDGMPLQPEEVEEEIITSARIFYTDAQEPGTAVVAAKAAKSAGMPVLADIEDLRPGIDRFLPLVDFFIVPAPFPELATGAKDLSEATRILEERTSGALVVVTLGAEGCVARIDGELERFPAYSVDVRDTTGAGDLFHAGFAVASLRGMELRDALDFSNAIAAMKCRETGGRHGIPHSIEEVERFRLESSHRGRSGGC